MPVTPDLVSRHDAAAVASARGGLRVLHVISGLGLGGAERGLLQLVQASDTTAVAALTPQLELAPAFPAPPWSFDLRRQPLAALRALWTQAQAFRPDVIQGWMYHGNLVASLLGRGLNRPVIWSIRHSLERFDAERAGVKTVIRLGRLSAFRCDRVVYNSATGWRTHARHGYGSRPSMMIPNGVDTERFRPRGPGAASVARARLLDGDVGERPLFAAVMRYHPMKNIHGLLDAWALLPAPRPALALIGSGMTSDNAALTQALAARALVTDVHLCGPRSDLETLYPGFAAVLLPSAYGEGTPNVLLEAQACGVPAIATRVGDAPRVVADADALVPPDDAQALAAAVSRELARAPEDRATRAAARRAWVSAEFSLPRCHERYFALHAELASQPRYAA